MSIIKNLKDTVSLIQKNIFQYCDILTLENLEDSEKYNEENKANFLTIQRQLPLIFVCITFVNNFLCNVLSCNILHSYFLTSQRHIFLLSYSLLIIQI